MTDEQILALKRHVLPEGEITVHEIWKGQVLYAAKRRDSEEWSCLRKGRAEFVAALRDQ